MKSTARSIAWGAVIAAAAALYSLYGKSIRWRSLSSYTLIVLFVALVLLFLWFLPKRQVEKVRQNPETKGPLELENDYRQTLVQVVGGLAIFVTVYATFDNARLAQETIKLSAENVALATKSYELTRHGQVADRTFKALEMLSKENNMDAKVAAVFGLEQAANEDPQSEWPITDIMFNYVRVHANSRGRVGEPLPADISAILDFMRRRPWDQEYHQRVDYEKGERPSVDNSEYYKRINLPRVELHNAFLERAMLKKVILDHAHLEEARLCYGHFEGAYAGDATLTDADLTGSYWNSANLQDADLTCSRWGEADMDQIYLRGAKLYGADLTGAHHLSLQQLQVAEGDKSTRLSDESLRPPRWSQEAKVKCEIKVRCDE